MRKKIISLLLAAVTLFGCAAVFTLGTSALEDPEISNAASAYLYNIENSQAIYTYNPEVKVYPTSTVKIMVGIIALESLADRLDEKVTITRDMLSEVSGNNIKLQVGEEVKINDLIGALLVNGANDAAYALAYTVSGNVRDFVQLMNAKAASAEVGAYDTVYTNPTGIHDENMTTTAKDTCNIALYAYKNVPSFMDYASALKWTMEATNMRKAYTIYNRNCLLSLYYEDSYYYDKARGMNAGSTYEAGYCVVTTASGDVGGNTLTYLAVVMDAQSVNDTVYSYVNAKKLLDWAFDSYIYVDVLSPEQTICELPVTLATGIDYVTLVSKDSLRIYLPKDTDIDTDISLTWSTNSNELQAPIEKGESVGYVFALYKGDLIGKAELITTADISRSDLLYALYKIRQFTKSRGFIGALIAAIVLAIAYVLGSAYMRRHRNNARFR